MERASGVKEKARKRGAEDKENIDKGENGSIKQCRQSYGWKRSGKEEKGRANEKQKI